MKVLEVDRVYYMSVLGQIADDKRIYLDDTPLGDKYYLVFEGFPVGGFITNQDGMLGGIFSLKRGIGRRIVALAIKYQEATSIGSQIGITCIGNFLMELYEDFGFEVNKVYAFDVNIAPKEWDLHKYGKPNVYFMLKQIVKD